MALKEAPRIFGAPDQMGAAGSLGQLTTGDPRSGQLLSILPMLLAAKQQRQRRAQHMPGNPLSQDSPSEMRGGYGSVSGAVRNPGLLDQPE